MGEGVIPFLFYAEAFRRRKLRCYLLSELLHVALYQFTCNHWLKLLGQVHPSQRTLVFSARCWLQQYARPQLMVAVYYAFGHFGFKLNHALILGRNLVVLVVWNKHVKSAAMCSSILSETIS